jgi:phosphatidylserine/phosphatidylglycerophosphate/cardiolipin synthase-like enzyme
MLDYVFTKTTELEHTPPFLVPSSLEGMMKKQSSILFLLCLGFIFLAPNWTEAKSITEDEHYSFEVLFTNPECATYNYAQEVYANNGELLAAKPQNAYCTGRDRAASGNREEAPQQRLVDWINDENLRSISLAFFSFSDSRVLGELCQAVERGVQVRLVIDQANEQERAPKELKKCGAEIIPRGGTSGIDLAHIKLILFETSDDEVLRLVFGSGNLSSGTVLHHENWNFVQLSRTAYFAQDHLCAYEGMVAAGTGAEFRSYLQQCRSEIQSQKESDIQTFFIPADNRLAQETFLEALNGSESILLAAHRFSNKKIFTGIENALRSQHSVRLILDDDVYWAQKGFTVGANTKSESDKIYALEELGTEIQYVETNHYEKLLHHNKFAIFNEAAVWTGAGNLTDSGFSGNYENFYYITIPEVVSAFSMQYDYLWSISTSRDFMPTSISKPIP